MLRLLTTRRWLTWLLVATLWAALCVAAGLWQWHRWEDKSAAQNHISRNYDATPVSFSAVLSREHPPAAADDWKQVRGTGRYIGSTIMVRNRPGPGGDFGYQTLNVLAVDGLKVLVDRGWVPNGTTAAAPASIPSPPAGEVTVTGWVRPSEAPRGRPEVAGQLASISVADARQVTGEPLADGYVRMRDERTANGTAPPRPQALEKPSQGQAAGINLSYAIQWGLGIIAGYAFVLLRARREHLDMIEEAGESAVSSDPEADGDGGLPSRPVKNTARPARPRRERKTRIWDEEDE